MYKLSNINITYPEFSLKVDDFHIEKGKLYSIVGPNGSGKSTLLNLLAFIENATSGELVYKNEKITDFTFNNLLNKRKNISYLLQKPFLFSMNVFENIACGLKIRNYSKEEILQKVNFIMEQLFITHLKHRKVFDLSGGEAQRVALARTLVIDAEIYLLDEPTSNIDKENIKNIEALIIGLKNEKNATIIQATHSLNQAYRMSDHVVSIINGKMKNLPYENVFSGILSEKDGVAVLPLQNNVEIAVGSDATGQATIAVDPNDLILSKSRINSSALNEFKGTIVKIDSYNGSLQVFVDVGVTFCTLITQKSYNKMGVNIGSEVYVTFKANSVKVI
ncbi:MAG: ABC transporter ATP-binding protein [Calditrichia bacterium]|nr:ABC transporter ATP-binding protein [Calditrichia bacterium]